MYCNKCGKFTETEDILCADCKAKEQQQLVHPAVAEYTTQASTTLQPTAEIKPAPSNGFGVASMVLGIIEFFMAAMALSIAEPGNEFEVSLLYLFAQPAIIIAIVNGIKAVVVFIKATKNKQAKPTAGFVMGIVGLNLMAIAMICLMLAMLGAEAFYY